MLTSQQIIGLAMAFKKLAAAAENAVKPTEKLWLLHVGPDATTNVNGGRRHTVAQQKREAANRRARQRAKRLGHL